MQQISEGGEHTSSPSQNHKLDKTVTEIQHELDMLFSRHEELRAKRTLTTQIHTLRVGFLGLIYFSREEEKAAISLGIMYFPLLTSILLHRPIWKIRKLIYLYTHHKNMSRKELEDPRNERE